MANVGKGGPNDPDQGWPLYIVSVVMVIVSGIFVLGRVGIRLARRMMGWDDYMIILALVSLIFLTLTECLAVVHGYGKHAKNLTHAQVVEAFKWFYGAQITYKLAVCFYKESMLFLYLRIFPGERFRVMCFVLIGLVTSSGIAFVLVTIFQCSPVAGFWDKTLIADGAGFCFSSEAFWFSYSVINIILDVMVLILPLHEVLKLQLPWGQKLGLVGVFSLGIFVCATTIIRTTTLASSAQSTDPTWGVIPATIWSVVEANTGTICACLPMLKQPLAILFPQLFSGSKSSSIGAGQPGIYPLRSSRKKSTNASNTVPDYHQWAMADGTIMSAKGGDDYSSRDSEERMIEHGQMQGQNQGILRRTEVNVSYDGPEGEAWPVLDRPHEVYAG